MVDDARRAAQLKAYETYVPTSTPMVERMYKVIVALVLLAFFAVGMWFRTVEPMTMQFYERTQKMIRTSFMVQEKKKPEPPKPKPKPKKPPRPIDLTDKPKMAQKADDIKKPAPTKKKVRRVYGLKRVYSTGLGAGGRLSDAVIGKLGNTINKDVDTITATEQDIKGQVVSVTTVTMPPRVRKRGTVEYSPEMLEAKFEGTVRVKCLVDTDGKVKKALPLSNPGFGAAEMAAKFCFQMEFEPATREGEPVAVWIPIKVNFRLLG